MAVPDWLVSGKPVAHRGLHGIDGPENSWGAFRAAIAEGYPIEFDLQLTGDGELLVFHDRNLKRMTGKGLAVTTNGLERLQRYPLVGTEESAPSFKELLSVVDGAVPLVIEVKPAKMRHRERAHKVLDDLQGYGGDFVLQSFDTRIVQTLKKKSDFSIGLIVGRYKDPSTPKELRRRLEEMWLAEAVVTPRSLSPDFIAHDIKRLTPEISHQLRTVKKLPLITWTVNSEAKAAKAKLLTDNYIFEAIQPA